MDIFEKEKKKHCTTFKKMVHNEIKAHATKKEEMAQELLPDNI